MIADVSVVQETPSIGGAGKLRKRVERLMMVLSRILSARRDRYDLQSAFGDITATLVTLVPHDAAVLMSWQDRQQNARVQTFTPEDLNIDAGGYLPASSLTIEMCRGNLGTAISLNTGYSSDSLERILAKNGIQSSITLPLSLDGETKYLLTLGAMEPGVYDSKDASLLKKLAPHLAACLKQVWGPAKTAIKQQPA